MHHPRRYIIQMLIVTDVLYSIGGTFPLTKQRQNSHRGWQTSPASMSGHRKTYLHLKGEFTKNWNGSGEIL